MMGATTCSTLSGADKAIARLEALGINFLALDFDQTILSIHTGGRWPESHTELLPHIRPQFRTLIQGAVANNIQVGVVTFTGQINLVRAILDDIVGAQAAERIPIRGADRSWQYNGTGSQEGKQPHMASAVEELITNAPSMNITKKTTLLIDDDPRNIRYALNDGTRAIWFNPEQPGKLFDNIAKLV